MNKEEILKNKLQSQEKWNDVLKGIHALESNIIDKEGYCRIYQDCTISRKHECHDCPLYQCEACSPEEDDNSLYTQILIALDKMERLTAGLVEDIGDDIAATI